MSTKFTLADHDAEAFRRQVQYKVRRFFGRHLSHHDFEDVCSQTMVEVLAKLSRFDPDRASLPTFIDRATDSSLLDQYRRSVAAKRVAAGNVRSLHAGSPGADGGFDELWQTLDSRSDQRRRARWPKAQSQQHLESDWRSALDKLSERERSLLESKLSGDSAPQIAAKLGVCRGTVYRQLIALRTKLRSLEIYV